MSTSLIHAGPAFELSVAIAPNRMGHHVRFLTFVPIASRPEHQVRLEALLSPRELRRLQQAIEQALQDDGAPVEVL